MWQMFLKSPLSVLRNYRGTVIGVFGLLIFGALQLPSINFAYLTGAENHLIDLRYRIGKKVTEPHKDIILIGVTSSSFSLSELSEEEIKASEALQLMRQPWPWNRKVHAAILDKLMADGAKAVAFDFVFAGAKDGDEDLRLALEKHRESVVIGQMFVFNEDDRKQRSASMATPETVLPQQSEDLVGFVNVGGEAVASSSIDTNPVIRNVWYKTSLFKINGSDGFPDDLKSLSLLAVEKFTERPVIPPSNNETIYADFSGLDQYEVIKAETLFVPKLWKNRPTGGQSAQDKIKGKLVFIGPAAEIFKDVQNTPYGPMLGVEFQANQAATLLRKSWYTKVKKEWESGLTALVILLVSAVLWKVKQPGLKGLGIFAMAALYFVAAIYEFKVQRLVFPMAMPLTGLFLHGAFGLLFDFILERHERQRVRSVLDRYVSKNVASLILTDRESFESTLKGSKKGVTVVFSDIRGFTSMTEATDATHLVDQLNEYFLQMVDIVLKQDGTLQKYIGDAIMAVWGDTHSNGAVVDAEGAVRTAYLMRLALIKLNDGWKENPNRMDLKIGIGINYGEAVVGNIGHPQRMEFTVLGDAVNLAARLESGTKQYHTDLLIGETVEKMTRAKFIFRIADLMVVKGKTKPVEVFCLLGPRGEVEEPARCVFEDGGVFGQVFEAMSAIE